MRAGPPHIISTHQPFLNIFHYQYHPHIILKIMLISFPQPTISQYFPHIILLPFSYPHIILNINLISFPQRQHFSKSSSSTTHSQICIGPKGDSFLGDLRNIDIFNYKNYDLEIHIEYFANSATFAWNHWLGILQHWRNVSVLPAPQVYTRCKM